ncbi:anti-sigma factor domain-containing protein [Pelotomaculum propionicicum]|uniref:anti-sigma factor domain-containing protein n=1 Tax=Pelotomaculum propionicicum TaxID=258475 RepID=UPI003B7EBA03
MVEERGMIVKIEGRSCIAVTPAGDFVEVPLPKGGGIRIGQEISLAGRRKRIPYLRYLMAAASFLIIFLTSQLYIGRTPQAVAYLTMDINPSIELAISDEGKVVSCSGLNSDGEKILSQVTVKGCDLEQAVEIIVTQAIADKYLTTDDSNVILTTLTVNEDSNPVVDLEHVYNAIKTSMDSGGVVSEVVIEAVEPEMRQEAVESGISTGRLLLQKKTFEKSLPVSVSEIGTIRFDKIERENKVSIVNLIGEGSGDVREYNLEKGEGAGIVKKGLYAERRNNNIKIKTGPQRGQGSEKGKNNEDKQNKYDNENKPGSENNQYTRDNENNQNNNDNENRNRYDSKNSSRSNSSRYSGSR